MRLGNTWTNSGKRLYSAFQILARPEEVSRSALENKCSEEFCKISRKHVVVSFFSEVE